MTDFDPEKVHDGFRWPSGEPDSGRIWWRDGGAGALSFTTAMFLTSLAVEDFWQTVRLTGEVALATHPPMNDLSQDAWFYTQNGEKGGPVGFADLQRMAKDGKLHPRQDLIWAKGMDRWQAAGEIKGLFERRTEVEAPMLVEAAAVVPARPATVVPLVTETAVDPYGASEKDAYGQTEAVVGMPGARRPTYLFFLIVFPVLWFALVGVAGKFMGGRLDQESLSLIVSGLLLLPAVVTLIFTFMRLVNLGMSGWWFLGNFVPLLNLWVGYRCFACPPGYAIYKKMDRAGIILAILYWLLMLAGIVAFGALVAIIFFDMGSDKLRDQILDPIKENIYRPAKP